MPIRTVSFLAGALVALLVAGTVAFVNAEDPWEPDPAAAERLKDTSNDEPGSSGDWDGPAPPQPTVAGYFQTLEDAARVCIAVEDGIADGDSADGDEAKAGCEAAREEYGQELTDAIDRERAIFRALEDGTSPWPMCEAAEAADPDTHRGQVMADACERQREQYPDGFERPDPLPRDELVALQQQWKDLCVEATGDTERCHQTSRVDEVA